MDMKLHCVSNIWDTSGTGSLKVLRVLKGKGLKKISVFLNLWQF